MQICLDGHDCGKFIPHLQVTPAPNNSLMRLHLPLDRHASMMGSAS